MRKLKEWANSPDKPFKSTAAKLWHEFFEVADESVDIAHVKISVDSATVRLSSRKSCVDESDPDWSGIEPSIVLVKGITQRFRESESNRAARRELLKSFRAWAEKGIVEAFESSRIQKRYEKFNTEGSPFAIVAADTDWGLHDDDLSVLWSSRPTFTVRTIKARQASARKNRRVAAEGRRGQKLKKKKGVTKKKATKKKSVGEKTTKKKATTKKKSTRKKPDAMHKRDSL